MPKIPKELVELATSPIIYKACERIGEKFGLHLDQMGELDSLIADVLVGNSKSADFVENVEKSLNVSREKASDITTEVNKEVFEVIKSQMQAQKSDDTVSAIERAGGFSVEKPDIAANDTADSEPAHVEPLTDHLLGGSATQSEEKTEPEQSGPDPYKEPLS